MIQTKLRLPATKGDLLMARRLPAPHRVIPPILITFRENVRKMMVLSRRKVLKGHRVAITEDLGVATQQRVLQLQANDHVKDVWTWNGILNIRDHDGHLHTQHYGDRLPLIYRDWY